MKTRSFYLRLISIVVAALLCACVDEVLVEHSPQASEVLGEDSPQATEACATPAETNELLSGPCPTGSTAVCNPSGSCRCCWPTVAKLCCRTSEPYQRCNPSGRCRCSAT